MAAPKSRHKINLAAPEFREMQREAVVDRAGIDMEARTVPLSFASEQPVDRWFGREILDITSEACDLKRLKNGGAVLVNHDWDRQVGVVLECSIDPATKKARAIVKFSRSQAGEDIFRDITDGIRSLVSVGYIVRKMVLQSVDGDVETHRVTDWQPFEISVVAVPADTSVGVGRAAPKPEEKPSRPFISMAETATAPTADELRQARENASTSERNRVRDINAAAKVLIEKHPDHADSLRSLANKCNESGDGLDAFNRTVLNDILGTQRTLAPVTQDKEAASLGLSKKDKRRYSILKAVRQLLENKPVDGLERECSDELAKKLERQPFGFFLPDDITADRRSQRALNATTPSEGGYLVDSEVLGSELVTFLRNQTRVMALGARVISGLRGDISIPRQLTGQTAYWVSETGTITASNGTFGQITGKPRRLGTSIPYTKQFLAQTSLSADQFVVADADDATAVELDRVAINGAGASEPLGILNLASGDLSTVTFSAAPTWAKYLAFFQALAEAKTLGLGTPAYLTTPASAVKAMSIAKFSNTSNPIWDENNKIGAFRAEWSNQFPSGDKVIFGDFSQVLYLEWAGRDVIVDPYGTNATTGQVTVTIQRMVDMVIRRAKSFVRSTDSGAQ